MARIKGPSRGPSRASKFLVVLVGGFLLGVFGSWLVMDTFRAFKDIGMAQRQKEQSAGLASNTQIKDALSTTKQEIRATTDQAAMAVDQLEQEEENDFSSSINNQITEDTLHYDSDDAQEEEEAAVVHHTPTKTAITTTKTSTTSKSSSKAAALFPSTGDTIHVLLTSGGGAYQNFQSRVMYGTYNMVRKLPKGEKLVAFTRILHRVKSDALMKEIPTFHAKPLQPQCDEWCDFPPASRPDAVRQFFDAAKKDPTMIKAPWLFMTECDYVWIKPVSAPRAEDTTAKSIAYPFTYIQPTNPGIVDVISRLYPNKDSSEIPPTGPAPALMRVHEWLTIMPHWERITAEIEEDEVAKDKLGWVREMYAFSIACALEDVKLELELPPNSPLMIQPPADANIGEAALMHYTWGSIISDKDGNEVWRFDKREYTDEKYEKNPGKLPEVPMYDVNGGWRLQDGIAVNFNLRDTLDLMIKTMNEAIEKLKPLP